MGCQTEVELGSNLTFSVCTHDPDTGVLTDADSVPSYRVYEDETEAVILSGTMSKLDDANTTGFYSEKIACTAANGFEVNKSYTIYITAAVGGDTGAIPYGFRVTDVVATIDAVKAKTDLITTGTLLTIVSGISGSDLTILRGDTLSVSFTGLGSVAARTKLWFTVKDNTESHKDTEAIIQVEETAGLLYIAGAAVGDSGDGSIAVDDESAGDVTVTVAASETAKLNIQKRLSYDIQMLTASAVTTLCSGDCEITADSTRATS